MASRMLATASASESPCDQQPGSFLERDLVGHVDLPSAILTRGPPVTRGLMCSSLRSAEAASYDAVTFDELVAGADVIFVGDVMNVRPFTVATPSASRCGATWSTRAPRQGTARLSVWRSGTA